VRSDERLVQWTTWDGEHHEQVRIAFENGGWTLESQLASANVTYVFRLDEHWQMRQFLLFRDDDEPDLWLATDGQGSWGEVNGAVRDDLAGCVGVALDLTPITTAIAVQRLRATGSASEAYDMAMVDVETLGVTVHRHRLTTPGDEQWHHYSITTGRAFEFAVDQSGLLLDEPGRFRRTSG
jgi:uncharacterized protein